MHCLLLSFTIWKYLFFPHCDCLSISLFMSLLLIKHGKPMMSAASELAMVLTRGLSMEQQKSSCDSLQYSSGYSTQNTTPSCSEDTIPSHGKPTFNTQTHTYIYAHAVSYMVLRAFHTRYWFYQ